MRNSLRAALLVAALVAAFVPAAVSAGRQGPVVGGYKAVAANDPEVTAAARFAAAARARKVNAAITLVSVEQAERQTVQGANYRLCLKVEAEDVENNVVVTETIRAVVDRSLKKEYTLRSWQPEDCGGEED